MQPGLAVRVADRGGRVRAVTLTKNVFGGTQSVMNVLTWDTGRRGDPWRRVGSSTSRRSCSRRTGGSCPCRGGPACRPRVGSWSSGSGRWGASTRPPGTTARSSAGCDRRGRRSTRDGPVVRRARAREGNGRLPGPAHRALKPVEERDEQGLAHLRRRQVQHRADLGHPVGQASSLAGSPPARPAATSSPSKSSSVSAVGSSAAMNAATPGSTVTGPAATAADTDSAKAASSSSTCASVAALTERWMLARSAPYESCGCTYQPRPAISSHTVNGSQVRR